LRSNGVTGGEFQRINNPARFLFNRSKKTGGRPHFYLVDQKKLEDDLTDWEKEIFERTGYVRWESILHFSTVDCVKARFLRKNKGVWYLTEEGEKAMKLGPVKLLESAMAAYRQ